MQNIVILYGLDLRDDVYVHARESLIFAEYSMWPAYPRNAICERKVVAGTYRIRHADEWMMMMLEQLHRTRDVNER